MSGPVPLGKDSGKGRLYGWRFALGNGRLEPPIGRLGSYIEKMSPLAGWRAGGTNRGLWEAWTSFLRSAHTLAPQAGGRGQIENCSGGRRG